MITNAQLANGRPWVIAGGWAACPQLASDQDVWIFSELSGDDLFYVKDFILQQFPSIEIDDTPTADKEAYENIDVNVLRVGKLDNRHIMVTDANDVRMLLECFDISTHQCAISENFEFIKGRNWTPITVAPIALRETVNTPARLKKISERYAALGYPKLTFKGKSFTFDSEAA